MASQSPNIPWGLRAMCPKVIVDYDQDIAKSGGLSKQAIEDRLLATFTQALRNHGITIDDELPFFIVCRFGALGWESSVKYAYGVEYHGIQVADWNAPQAHEFENPKPVLFLQTSGKGQVSLTELSSELDRVAFRCANVFARWLSDANEGG